jgi:stearoyl-CoA desaturase (delta-9 desaturase)
LLEFWSLPITDLHQTASLSPKQNVELDWINVIGIGSIHFVALFAVFPYFFSITGLIFALAGTFVFGTLGINVFYHRYLTHKSFQCPKWFEHFMAVLAVCCFQESPARWVAVHRRHHEHSDDEPDPHSPIRSFLWAHVGWLMVKNSHLSPYELYGRYAKDVLRDPFYKKLEDYCYYLGIFIAHASLFFAAGTGWDLISGGSFAGALQFGLSVLIWGVFVRIVLVWHITWSVNSITHIWGYKNFETGENSRNNFIIGVLAGGEGWHNNHHADPRSAKHGHYWWEIDITYLVICAMGATGLAWRITMPNRKAG